MFNPGEKHNPFFSKQMYGNATKLNAYTIYTLHTPVRFV